MSGLDQVAGTHGLQVAVLEDNPGLLDDVLDTLHQHGCKARGFSRGTGLDIAMAAGATFKVLVLDLGLPGEDEAHRNFTLAGTFGAQIEGQFKLV